MLIKSMRVKFSIAIPQLCPNASLKMNDRIIQIYIIYLSSNIINIIFESFKLSINMKYKAPENGIHNEYCQR